MVLLSLRTTAPSTKPDKGPGHPTSILSTNNIKRRNSLVNDNITKLHNNHPRGMDSSLDRDLGSEASLDKVEAGFKGTMVMEELML